MTTLILIVVDFLMGVRVSEDEEKGLDSSLHGETVMSANAVAKYEPVSDTNGGNVELIAVTRKEENKNNYW